MPDNHEALARQLKRLNDNLETLFQRLTVAPFPPPQPPPLGTPLHARMQPPPRGWHESQAHPPPPAPGPNGGK